MKKKILTLMLATSMVAVMLVGCGDKSSEATTATTQSATGSDDRDSDETADVPASGDAPADGGTVSSTPATFEEKIQDASALAIEEFGNEIPLYNMELTSEKLDEYMGEQGYRQIISAAIFNQYQLSTKLVYNAANYNSTLAMIEAARLNFEQIDGAGDMYNFSNGDNRPSDEQIANAIDALVEHLGTKVSMMVIMAEDNAFTMFYCDNGIGYGARTGATTEKIEFVGDITYENENGNRLYYVVYPDGTVEDNNL